MLHVHTDFAGINIVVYYQQQFWDLYCPHYYWFYLHSVHSTPWGRKKEPFSFCAYLL